MRYNFAYFPSNPEFTKNFIVFAQSLFADLANAYLLNNKDALPHVTLCQFDADEKELPSMWGEALKLQRSVCTLTFDAFYSRPHSKDIFAGFTMIPTNELLETQSAIVALIDKRHLKRHTKTGDAYFPHMTLSDLRTAIASTNFSWPHDKFGPKEQPFHLTIGASSENGKYLRKLYSAE